MNNSFLSILSAFLICSFRTSLYYLSRNFYLMIAQFLSYSVAVEQFFFNLRAWLYRMLFLKDHGCSDWPAKYACWPVGLQYKIVWMLIFSSLYIFVSRNEILFGKISKSNLIILSFLILVVSLSIYLYFLINLLQAYIQYI